MPIQRSHLLLTLLVLAGACSGEPAGLGCDDPLPSLIVTAERAGEAVEIERLEVFAGTELVFETSRECPISGCHVGGVGGSLCVVAHIDGEVRETTADVAGGSACDHTPTSVTLDFG